MSRNVEIEVFQYSELTGKAKEYARERIRDGMDFVSQHITESFREDLSALGYPATDIRWSLSYCQGDGAAFYGRMNAALFAQKRLTAKIPSLELSDDEKNLLSAVADRESAKYQEIEITRVNSHYDHYDTMRAEMEFIPDENPEDSAILNALLEFVREDIRVVSRFLEKSGYAEIEYCNSDEYIAEHADANGYEFTADGRIF